MADKPAPATKTLATNRRARFNYTILDTFEAGIALTGSEIKSVRAGHVNIAEAYVQIKDGQAWLHNAHISQYLAAGPFGQHETTRERKLLLHKEQIKEIGLEMQRQRLTIIPLRLYIKGRVAKVEIALGRGKIQADKRETIKQRDADREMSRAMKTRA
jgi:SsrA-binding protein